MSSWETTVVPMIRKRPGMYIGDARDGTGLHHMLWEVVSNVVDEHLAGHCRHAKVVLHADGSLSVTDDGRGISVDADEHGQRYAERVVTALHTSPTRDGHYPHAHVGLFGVGLAVVNALSDSFVLDVRRDGGHWTQRFARGRPLTKFRRRGAARQSGTSVRFRPDPAIFGPSEYAYEPIKQRLTELNAMSLDLAFDLRDERRRSASIRSTGGLADLLVAERRAPVTDVIRLQASGERCRIDVAAEWNADGDDRIASFVNMQQTRGGGTHAVGLRMGLMDGAARFAHPQGVSRPQAHRTVMTGLHAAIHVLIAGDPTFGGPTRDRLADADVGLAVRALVAQAFFDELSRTPAIWRRLHERAAPSPPSPLRPGRRGSD